MVDLRAGPFPAGTPLIQGLLHSYVRTKLNADAYCVEIPLLDSGALGVGLIGARRGCDRLSTASQHGSLGTWEQATTSRNVRPAVSSNETGARLR